MVGIAQFKTTEAETIAFVQRNALTFPNFFDERAEVADAYDVQGVPSYVFLDKQGKIAYRSSGARGTELIENWLEILLAE